MDRAHFQSALQRVFGHVQPVVPQPDATWCRGEGRGWNAGGQCLQYTKPSSRWWFQILFILRFGLSFPTSGDLVHAKRLSGLVIRGVMVSSSWGIKGDPVLWSIDFSKLQPGSCIDLVATVISIVDDGISMVVSLFPCGTRARIEGLPNLPSDTDMISIYGAVLCDGHSFPTFRIHEQSIPMWFPKPTYGDLLQIRELCSGMGVATEGLVKSGFCPTVACDLRQPFMDAYKFFHPEVTTITGNISDPETIVKIWEAHPRVASLFAGFACQPFSKGGSQKGANDSRANTLYSVLHAGHMMRAPIFLLECVSEAGTNNFVIQQVDEFCRQCHFVRSEIYLSLEHCCLVKGSMVDGVNYKDVGQSGTAIFSANPFAKQARSDSSSHCTY